MKNILSEHNQTASNLLTGFILGESIALYMVITGWQLAM